MSLVVSFVVLSVLFILSGFFAGAETAFFSLSKIEKRRLKEEHPKLSNMVLRFLEKPRQSLTTLLIGNLLVQTLATALVALIAIRLWGPHAIGWTMVVFTMLLILIGEIIPKVVAVRKNVAMAMILIIPVKIFAFIITPIRFVMRVITDWLIRVLTLEKKEHPDQISEEELKIMVKIGEEEGVLDRQERYMIQKLFELGERPAKDIMIPRIDVAGLDIEDKDEEHVSLMRKYHFSHFPVYRDSMDHVLGVVSSQDYLLAARKKRKLSSFLHQPLFVPETKRIDDLLAEFRKKKIAFAVCVDEHGGTAGIVTLEDVLEEIFGEFYDEYAKVENPIRPLGVKEYVVEAKIALNDFNEFFSFNLESEEATLGGYILEKLGEVPQVGKVLQIPECEIRIQEMIRQRIRKVVVIPKS